VPKECVALCRRWVKPARSITGVNVDLHFEQPIVMPVKVYKHSAVRHTGRSNSFWGPIWPESHGIASESWAVWKQFWGALNVWDLVTSSGIGLRSD
jgi:hypothetical protein